ncbi:hypothetical protein EAF00_011534 [Botryotinia globosa]|nr:hypothetical protein EAF00_011534 [Botryotinia globosa]
MLSTHERGKHLAKNLSDALHSGFLKVRNVLIDIEESISTSKVYLILIETDDKLEFNAIWEPFISATTKAGYFATALVFKHEGPPKVSSQTYGLENCLTNCCSQVKNILIQKKEAIRNYNEEIKFHPINVGATGSYLKLNVEVDGKKREVEFNVALYINPFAETFGQRGGFWHISKGATLPDHFYVGRHTTPAPGFQSGSFEWELFKADIWLIGKDKSDRSGRRELAYKPKPTTSKPATTKTETPKKSTPELTRGRSNSTTPSSAISNSRKLTRDRSNSATPKASISVPVKPKFVTHRSGRSKAAPSEADESTSDTTPLIKHSSDKPKAAPLKPARPGQEKFKAATPTLDKSLHKLDPRRLNSKKHNGYKQLEERQTPKTQNCCIQCNQRQTKQF